MEPLLIMLLRPVCLLGLLLISVNAWGVDLITVYQEAVRTNPQLAAAAANLEAVRERRPQALAGLLPEVIVDDSDRPDRELYRGLRQLAVAGGLSVRQFGGHQA